MPKAASTSSSYKSTLNLPKTTFPMKANLVQKEPQAVTRWSAKGDQNLYRRIRKARAGAPRYVFHDGPPYANGSIHLGHLLNKVLKDLVVRSKTMAGYECSYVPGWDCHGLPIEHKVMQDLGPEAKGLEPFKVRRKCKAYAEKFVKLQSSQMQRLLTLADYDNPYLTMNPGYEAAVLEVFADLVSKGLVYRALKPVHWSIANQTALADAELEYHDRQDTSVYVLFDVEDRSTLPASFTSKVPEAEPIYLMIWTTTPWTLPANLAVAVNERFEYGLYEISLDGRKVWAIIARELSKDVLSFRGDQPPVENSNCAYCTGQALKGLRYRHPFIGRVGRVVGADYVTLDGGTGLVHTAPGHGVEDYQTGLREKLDVYCPVGADGTFDDTAPNWLQGVDVWKANELVVQHLQTSGHLFHNHVITHSYPHDWRSKTPVIFRATDQWFVSVQTPIDGGGSLQDRAMHTTEKDVQFIPEWGRNRMRGMLESRPDWCISRQRSWGLPIPAFDPPQGVKGRPLLTASSVRAVAQNIRQHGSDFWFSAAPGDLLKGYDPKADPDVPDWLAHGGGEQIAHLTKTHDIFDVWFESGSSWNAVLRQRQLGYPADLYLEGSDQHRGWFQLSLLPALGVTSDSPFKTVLTHGFMVDKDGRKMSKSGGNAVAVDTLLKDFGADVCRWWVGSLNADNDIKVDYSFFRVAGEEYRKVRNTLRYLLSNLNDFDPQKDRHEFSATDSVSIDAWAIQNLNQLINRVRGAYEKFQFRRVHEALFHFCNHTMSAVYLAATKDRLYCDKPDSTRRRRTQTAIFDITDALVRLVAPILPYTADEAWQALHGVDADTVHLELLPEATTGLCVDEQWPNVMQLRDNALKAIEEARIEQGIDNPLDCAVRITVTGKPTDGGMGLTRFDQVDLADLCGVSRVDLVETTIENQSKQADASTTTPAITFEVVDVRGEPRCQRCWKRDGTVKPRTDGGMLSQRDAQALGLS